MLPKIPIFLFHNFVRHPAAEAGSYKKDTKSEKNWRFVCYDLQKP